LIGLADDGIQRNPTLQPVETCRYSGNLNDDGRIPRLRPAISYFRRRPSPRTPVSSRGSSPAFHCVSDNLLADVLEIRGAIARFDGLGDVDDVAELALRDLIVELSVEVLGGFGITLGLDESKKVAA